MNLLKRLAGMLTPAGRSEDLLKQGLEHAKAHRPHKAIQLYNTLLDSEKTSDELRARALFNRALAHSALKDDERAAADLTQVLGMPALAENVYIAARSQLARVKKRNERSAPPEVI